MGECLQGYHWEGIFRFSCQQYQYLRHAVVGRSSIHRLHFLLEQLFIVTLREEATEGTERLHGQQQQADRQCVLPSWLLK